MSTHRFDAPSLVLGVLALALGVAALTGRLGELINRPAMAIPLGLALVGLAVIASARPPGRARTEVSADEPPG